MEEAAVTESAQYLTFVLAEEVYALSISQVREVLDYTRITKVPRMPAFIRGVINLRGGVVPVADLRLKFGMEMAEESADTCIVITEVILDGEVTLLGVLADAVREVVTLSPEQIEPPPKIGTRLDTAFIRGMGKKDEEFIIILETERVFSDAELSAAHGGEPAACGIL